MTTCCFCLSIKTGCYVGSVCFFIIAIVKLVLVIVKPLAEGPETVVVFNILLLIIAGMTLLIGTIMEDRVSVITFLCFDVTAMVTQALGLLVLHLSTAPPIKLWVFIVMIIEQIPFLYMIAVGILLYRIVKERHMHIADHLESVSASRVHTPRPGRVPGLGF